MTPPRPGSVLSGLYDPAYEHDACGVAFVARLDGVPSHETVERALDRARATSSTAAPTGADAEHRRRRGHPAADARRVLPRGRRRRAAAAGPYGVGVCFLPHDDARRAELEQLLERRSRPRASAWSAGATSRSTSDTSASRANASRPRSGSSSSAPASSRLDQDAFERKLYVIRRVGRARRRRRTSSSRASRRARSSTRAC